MKTIILGLCMALVLVGVGNKVEDEDCETMICVAREG